MPSTISTINVIGGYDLDVWKVQVIALKTAAAIESPLNYLAYGMTLGELSLNARIAYTKSIAVLLRSGIIDSENRILAIKLATALASSSALQVRIKATACIAECSKKWGSPEVEDVVFALSRDENDEVVYSLLDLCKRGEFGDTGFEQRIIDILAKDANWFIRWHVAND